MSIKQEILTGTGIEIKILNRRKAIRERCVNCSGFSFKDVDSCKFKDCELYPYRMGKLQGTGVERNKAIKKYCTWCVGGENHNVKKCSAKKCPLWSYRTGGTDRTQEIKEEG